MAKLARTRFDLGYGNPCRLGDCFFSRFADLKGERQAPMTTSEIANREQSAVARPLNVLVSLIKKDLEQAQEASERACMPYYLAAGEKMIEAKSQMKKGEFAPWLKRNFGLSYVHAERYMTYARATRDTHFQQAREFSSMNQFLKSTGNAGYVPNKPRPRAWHEGVQESIERAKREAERLREAELTRQQEREAEQQLALRLIDIGFKVLAKELHPDKGGSRDTMARLNRVRDRLKQHA
jgi:hypothetical protein